MKILAIADSFTGLFPKRITTTLIHEISGNVIGIFKIDAGTLPQSFNKPTLLEINRRQWRVTSAEPSNADDYLRRKKLTLHVLEADHFNKDNEKFIVPTRAFPMPALTNSYLFNDFTLTISPDDWRQLELLPVLMLPLIEEESKTIESILTSSNPSEALRGYDKIHIRENIGQHCLSIPFDDFCQHIAVKGKGNIHIGGSDFVQHGFSIQSEDLVYYGTVQDNLIRELNLHEFSVNDEFMYVLQEYELVLVDWCNGEIIASESESEP